MQAALASFGSRPQVRGLQAAENKLRLVYLTIDLDEASIEQGDAREERELLDASARVLEAMLATACYLEARDDLGIETLEEAVKRIDELVGRVRALCGLELFGAVAAAKDLFEETEEFPSSQQAQSLLPVRSAIRMAKSVIEACPIDYLENVGRRVSGIASLSHRCRVAYDGLGAFVRRQAGDRITLERVKIAGRLYVAGSAELRDVATLLDVNPETAIWLLEQHGFCRPLDTVQLTADQRVQLLGRVRADRLNRNGEPRASERYVARDAIASERIEGIDARRWIPTTTS
jgi:hypothetical protein